MRQSWGWRRCQTRSVSRTSQGVHRCLILKGRRRCGRPSSGQDTTALSALTVFINFISMTPAATRVDAGSASPAQSENFLNNTLVVAPLDTPVSRGPGQLANCNVLLHARWAVTGTLPSTFPGVLTELGSVPLKDPVWLSADYSMLPSEYLGNEKSIHAQLLMVILGAQILLPGAAEYYRALDGSREDDPPRPAAPSRPIGSADDSDRSQIAQPQSRLPPMRRRCRRRCCQQCHWSF